MPRVTSKGQVTIPIAIRERLGIEAGTEIEFELDGDAVRLRKSGDGGRGAALVAHLSGRLKDSGWTTDELMALTRGE